MRSFFRTARAGIILLASLVLAGLAATAGADARRDADHTASLFAFFDGRTRSTGTVTTALVSTEAFTAVFSGSYRPGHLSLDERFTFESGKARQIWALSAAGEGRLTGTVRTELKDGTLTAARPVSGSLSASRLTLDYDGYAPNGSDTMLHFHHVMTAQEDGTVRNRVTVSKFYLPLATSDVTFFKPEKR